MIRYIRAFFIALRMTVRGEKPIPARHAAMNTWMQETVRLIDVIQKAADVRGIPVETRKALKVRVDGRDVSVDAVLGGVRYHAAEEYPYLLMNETEHSLTAVQASNYNDVYRMMRLMEINELAVIREVINTLTEHLKQMPPGTSSRGES